eukprot:1158892-Pelagomonas_calceolata.AAC.29
MDNLFGGFACFVCSDLGIGQDKAQDFITHQRHSNTKHKDNVLPLQALDPQCLCRCQNLSASIGKLERAIGHESAGANDRHTRIIGPEYGPLCIGP